MQFLEKYNLTPIKIVKSLGLILLVIIVLSFAFGFINRTLHSVSNPSRQYSSGFGSGMTEGFSNVSGMAMNKGMTNSILSSKGIMPSSIRNMASSNNDYTPGVDAEDFEITEYRAMIKTRNLEQSCNSIASLKSKDYVIFESSNSGDNNCNFRFKVEKDKTEEVLAVIESLNPREINESIETIKKQIDDFTSEEEILKRKLRTMDNTLSSAIIAYNEISKLATQTRDAGSLANIIESKIKIIERLSQEKINTSAKLERISRLKAERLDRLEYTYFNINIYENKYIDIDRLKDSWNNSIKSFVFNMNKVLQDLSIGLITLAAYTFQYLLYLLIMLVVGKYVWKLFKKIWNN